MDLDYLRSLEGLMLTEATCLKLAELAAGCPPSLAIVEIGSFKGKSTSYLAAGSRGAPVHAIEPWDLPGNVFGKHGYSRPEVKQAFDRQTAPYAELITAHQGFSYEVAKTWSLPIGLLFIDGSHEYKDVKRDLLAFEPWLALGAVVAFDDYGRANPGVIKFVEELRKGTRFRDWDFSVAPLAIGVYRG
jgi:hypothetical protein